MRRQGSDQAASPSEVAPGGTWRSNFEVLMLPSLLLRDYSMNENTNQNDSTGMIIQILEEVERIVDGHAYNIETSFSSSSSAAASGGARDGNKEVEEEDDPTDDHDDFDTLSSKGSSSNNRTGNDQ
jgi:hypothetical protein